MPRSCIMRDHLLYGNLVFGKGRYFFVGTRLNQPSHANSANSCKTNQGNCAYSNSHNLYSHTFCTRPKLNESATAQPRHLFILYTLHAMRITSRLLAAAAPVGNGLKPAPLAILPPIPLYRRLLRAHRKYLPHEMRVLGDQYIKSEFRLHQNVDNPAHLVRPHIV